MERLNGKLYPFLDVNEGSVRDYIDLQRLMFTLNQHFRSCSFQIFGDTRVSQSFLDNIRNGFEDFLRQYKSDQSGNTTAKARGSESSFPRSGLPLPVIS
ncbi:MAG: hypothetical protein JSU86_03010 [Phycisphaerales bacterium]|nr:MAG: hypothetical protein JSU86_03010 [Phycisphaerales bacterium]